MSPGLRLSDAVMARLCMLQRVLDVAGDELTGAMATRDGARLRRALRHFDDAVAHVADLHKLVEA